MNSFWIPWFFLRAGHESRGANVQYCGTQTHLGLGFWLNNVAHGPNLFLPKTPTRTHKSHGPKLCIAQKPEEWKIFISMHLVSPPGPCSTNHSRTIRKAFGYTVPWIPDNALGILLPSISTGYHSHHTPLPPKHPLTINNIGPPITLTLKAITIPPLTLGYKYMNLKKKRGMKETGKEIKEQGEASNPERERERCNAESLCAENNPT